MDGTMIKSPSVSSLRGSADTFESRIKIPKAPRELEEGSKEARTEFNKNKGKAWSLGRISCRAMGLVGLAEGGTGRARTAGPRPWQEENDGRRAPALWKEAENLVV